jgi:hypothetical protein
VLAQKDYPRDVAVFYCQSVSIATFLVQRKNPATLVAFVKDGMEKDWNAAAKTHYGFADVDALEAE